MELNRQRDTIASRQLKLIKDLKDFEKKKEVIDIYGAAEDQTQWFEIIFNL